MTYTFQDIIAWQKAHQFVILVYKVTSNFPPHEKFSLSSQFQRAAISIPANIAEGYRKDGIGDKLRFLNISQGSLEECRYYIILAKDLSYITEQTYDYLIKHIEETSKVLNAYYQAIKTNHGR